MELHRRQERREVAGQLGAAGHHLLRGGGEGGGGSLPAVPGRGQTLPHVQLHSGIVAVCNLRS